MDLLYYLPALDDALWTSARLMCQMPAFSAATASRIIAVLAARAASESQQQRFTGFLMSLLVGTSPASLSDDRHAEVASFAAQAMAAAAAGTRPHLPCHGIIFCEESFQFCHGIGGSGVRCLAMPVTGDPEVLHRLEGDLSAACVAATGSRAWLGLLLAVAAVAASASVPTHGDSRQADALGSDSPAGQPGSMPPQLLSALPEVVCRAVFSLSTSDSQSDARTWLLRGISAIISLLQATPSILVPLISLLPSAAGGNFR